MYISYIIYIILNSRCYTGVRAPKLSHRSSYIKEPFWEGLGRASRGLDGGFRRAWRRLAGLETRSRWLQGGLRRASRGLQCLRRAWRWLAWRGLQGEGGFKGASRGLEKGFKGASRGLEKGFKGAWEGLQGGLRRASRGLQGGFKPFSPSCPPPPGKGPFKPPLKGTFEGGGSDPAPHALQECPAAPNDDDAWKRTTERTLSAPWMP